MKIGFRISLIVLIALFMALPFWMPPTISPEPSQQSESESQVVTLPTTVAQERFVHFVYDVNLDDPRETEIKLRSPEEFPEKDSESYQKLEQLLQPGFAIASVGKNGRTLVVRSKDLAATLDPAVKVIGAFFNASMCNADDFDDIEFSGPWQISPNRGLGWSVRTDVWDSDYRASLREEAYAGGTYLMVTVTEGNSFYRQTFTVYYQDGKPLLRELLWVHPQPCGAYIVASQWRDLWGQQYARYIANLPERFQKYFNGDIAANLGSPPEIVLHPNAKQARKRVGDC